MLFRRRTCYLAVLRDISKLKLTIVNLSRTDSVAIAFWLVLWAAGLFLIWRQRKTPPQLDMFSKFMEWKITQNQPNGQVEDWINAPSKLGGAPRARLSRAEKTISWTALIVFFAIVAKAISHSFQL